MASHGRLHGRLHGFTLEVPPELFSLPLKQLNLRHNALGPTLPHLGDMLMGHGSPMVTLFQRQVADTMILDL